MSGLLRRVRSIGVAYGLAFALGSAVLGFAIYSLAQVRLAQIVDARLARHMAATLGPVRQQDVAAIRERIVRREAEHSISEVGHILLDAKGRRLAGTVIATPLASGYTDVRYHEGASRSEDGRALTKRLPGGETLVMVAESELAEDFNAMLALVFGFTIFFSIVSGFLGALALSRAISARVSGTSAAAEAIIAGDLSQRMPRDGTDSPFDRQAATLNRMLDKIDELMANLKQVSSDIAHDLRTPLTRMLAQVDGMIEGDTLCDADEFRLRQIRGEGQRLLRIFVALLRISEIEAGARRVGFAEVALDVLLEEVAETFQPVAEDQGSCVGLAIKSKVVVRGDRELLTQLLVNLVENALRHTPGGTLIQLGLASDGSMWVRDNGPGIPAAQRALALRRFTRMDSSRTSAGNGLGLALVDAIAGLHDAMLDLEDAAPGLCVRVQFPEVVSSVPHTASRRAA